MEVDASIARRRAARGVVALALRTAATQALILGGTVVLLRVLDPEAIGTLAVLQFVLTLAQVLAETGVGGALIQRREAPSEEELANVFTLHALLAIALFVLAWIVAPGLRSVWSALPAGAPAMLRVMALALLLGIARVVPTILLERGLRFRAIAVAEVAQTAAFYLAAVGCALNGLGNWSWPVAFLAQTVAGLLVVSVAQPWRPRVALDRAVLRPLIRFGFPFQFKSLVGFANGAVTPLYGGVALGTGAVGLVGWGQQLASLPLRLVEVIARVNFPLFARLQHDRAALLRALERSLQLGAFGVCFTSALLLTVGPNITTVVFSAKWLPGLVALYAFAAVMLVGFVSPIAGAFFDAAGRPGVIARLATGWTVLNWIVVPIATMRWGMVGFVLGSCVHVVVGNVAVLLVLRRSVPGFRFRRAIAAPAMGGAIVAAMGWFWLRPWATTLPRLVLGVAVALCAHVAAIGLADRQALRVLRDTLRADGAATPPP